MRSAREMNALAFVKYLRQAASVNFSVGGGGTVRRAVRGTAVKSAFCGLNPSLMDEVSLAADEVRLRRVEE